MATAKPPIAIPERPLSFIAAPVSVGSVESSAVCEAVAGVSLAEALVSLEDPVDEASDPEEVEVDVADASALVTDPAVTVTGMRSFRAIVEVDFPGKFASAPPTLSVQSALEAEFVHWILRWLSPLVSIGAYGRRGVYKRSSLPMA